MGVVTGLTAIADEHGSPCRAVGDTDRVVTVIDTEGAKQLGVRKIDAENKSALLERAVELGRKGLYIPRADHEFPLAEIARAHGAAESGSGKVVVTVG